MTAITSASSILDEAVTTALEREKSLFLARNADRCEHLLVRYRSEADEDRLVITAAFTLDELRRWNQVETTVALAPVPDGSGYDHRVIEAFGRLDEGIGTACIARLFAPMTEAERIASERE